MRRLWRSVGLIILGALVAGCTNGNGSTGMAPLPTSHPTDPATLTVSRSTFVVTYLYNGTTAPSSHVMVDVPAGTRFVPGLANGVRVSLGQKLGRLVLSGSAQLTREARASTVAKSRLQNLRSDVGPVHAPVAGRLAVMHGDPNVHATGLDVVVSLSPLQRLRYFGLDFSGRLRVETVFGYQAAPCSALWLVQSVGSSELHCRVPEGVETTAGLPATLQLRADIPRIIAVPAIYIGFAPKTNNYFVRKVDGAKTIRVLVTVGPTDGVRRVVTGGLHVGDTLRPLHAAS